MSTAYNTEETVESLTGGEDLGRKEPDHAVWMVPEDYSGTLNDQPNARAYWYGELAVLVIEDASVTDEYVIRADFTRDELLDAMEEHIEYNAEYMESYELLAVGDVGHLAAQYLKHE